MSADVGPTNENQGIRINSEEEQIASSNSAHRGHAHHVGVRFARKALSVGGVLSSFSSSGRSARSHRAVGEAKGRLRASGLFAHVGVRLARRGIRARRRVSGVWGQPVGHGRRRGVVHRRRQHSFERVGHSDRWARREQRAGVSSFDRGNQRRHRAVWRVIRNAVASSHNRGPGSFGYSGHQVRSRRTPGAFHKSPFGRRHRWASPRAARWVIRASSPSRASQCRGLIRRPAQHANGADAPDRLVRSCRCGARLICNVRPTTVTTCWKSQ